MPETERKMKRESEGRERVVLLVLYTERIKVSLEIDNHGPTSALPCL